MNDLMFDIMVAYLYDILVYAENFQQHQVRFRKVFERLREIWLKLDQEICQFAVRNFEFLGHDISTEGVGAIKSRREATGNIKQTRTLKVIRSFLGLASYFKRYVKHFANNNKLFA